MNRLLLILAQADPSDFDGVEEQYFNSPLWHETLAICGTLLAASIIAVLLGAYFFKQKKRRRRYHHHHQHNESQKTPTAQPKTPVHTHESRRSRRRRRSERPMNPTLAQTGGLPPVRNENPPWASSS
ncbi:MAG TPA: hypothetical protein VFB72_14530 [Verrucomicrobiae bacterium]|nr:hypothetical protein [Verrucomicrobiae bacterium]